MSPLPPTNVGLSFLGYQAGFAERPPAAMASAMQRGSTKPFEERSRSRQKLSLEVCHLLCAVGLGSNLFLAILRVERFKCRNCLDNRHHKRTPNLVNVKDCMVIQMELPYDYVIPSIGKANLHVLKVISRSRTLFLA